MVFSDTYYPGWKAYIDDSETKIYKTNVMLKGIYIPKGRHRIVFKYVPIYFWPTFIISLTGFVILILSIIILFVKRRKKVNRI